MHRMTAAFALILSLAPRLAVADEVTVFAAASMTEALTEIGERFEAETGHDVRLSFAGSSALARQIELGAPADIFVSANAGWMDALEGSGRIIADTRFDLTTNRMVLIAHDPATPEVEITPDLDLAGMLVGGRLAMALTEAVPAGIYGRAALESLGLWDSVAGQVAEADNVRAALMLVATGAAPLGIVYYSDAVSAPQVAMLGVFPEDSHPPITYPVALIAGHDSPVARAFLAYLRQSPATDIIAERGFWAPGG
jgi:molybdate transport system substrate-binding protein